MRILVVEDEATLRRQLVQAIAAAGHTVEEAADGEQAHYLGDVESFDAAVLDLGLPGMDGLTVLRHWRSVGRGMPVLILTARSAWHEKVAGLLRRAGAHTSAEWRCGPILLDTRQARVLVDGMPLTLTSHEFKLLSLLMQRKGQVLSRTELSEHIYPQDGDRDSNTIEVFVGRLRKKLPPGLIETVRGMGYRLVEAPAA